MLMKVISPGGIGFDINCGLYCAEILLTVRFNRGLGCL